MENDSLIRRFGLWSDEQHLKAQDLARQVQSDGIKLVRLVWPDIHGVSRAKTVTIAAFLGSLENGYNTNVATATLDPSGARVFSSFVQGGGMGLHEMTGSPNLVIIPDPDTFRVLPWEPAIGWILCDEYFASGVPFHFSPRQLLKKRLEDLRNRNLRSVVGLEVEWYLVRPAQAGFTAQSVGSPGIRGRAPDVHPVEPGFSFHSESNFDLVQPVVSALAEALEGLGMPLRSIEKEWGPGQLECTFGPQDALATADNAILFRTATRQICRRMGYLASFMTRPALDGFYASGWHLHQSLVDVTTGRNLFTPDVPGEVLSPLGMNYLGGLVEHGLAATVFANPTVNGYRRFRANSLAPDRIAWCSDHRGVMLRVLGGPNDPASRIENRMGEPFANPYLYILSQIASGMDGIGQQADPGLPDSDPYAAERPMLPGNLRDAVKLAQDDAFFREALGETFIDYYARLKAVEFGRFESFAVANKIDLAASEPTSWEQDEYFDFF